MDADLTLRVDGETRRLTVDTRTSLLDALRERLGNTSRQEGLRSRPVRGVHDPAPPVAQRGSDTVH